MKLDSTSPRGAWTARRLQVLGEARRPILSFNTSRVPVVCRIWISFFAEKYFENIQDHIQLVVRFPHAPILGDLRLSRTSSRPHFLPQCQRHLLPKSIDISAHCILPSNRPFDREAQVRTPSAMLPPATQIGGASRCTSTRALTARDDCTTTLKH